MDAFSDFKLYFPEVAKSAVHWYPSGRHEITVKFDDGTKVIYNHIFKTMRNVVYGEDEQLSEEQWRKEFGFKLRDILADKGWSQGDLADRSGISRITIGKYLSGRASPSSYTVVTLARVLGCSVNELTEFN